MYAIAYVRVSTEEQDLDTQVRTISEWATKNNITILRWYSDHGISGATPIQERPGFRQLVKDLDNINPRPSILLVYDITRIARSLREFILAWDYIENKLGLALVPVKDIHIFKVPLEYRNMLRILLATFSEIEREFIRRRTRDAMKRLQQEGKISNIVTKLLKENKELLDTICTEYSRGVPKYRIAKKYGLSYYAIERILREYCNVRVSKVTCPRCQHLMNIERREVMLENDRVIVRVVYYCKNCGYVQETMEE